MLNMLNESGMQVRKCIVILLAVSSSMVGADVLCKLDTMSSLYIDKNDLGLSDLYERKELKEGEQIELEYLLSVTTLENGKKRQAKKLLKASLNHFPEDKSGKDSAIESLLLGVKLRMSPYLGIIYGGKLEKALARAVELNPNELIVEFAQASYYHYTPESFGGNIDKAIEIYTRLVNRDKLKEAAPCWIDFASRIRLILAYESIGKLDLSGIVSTEIDRDYPGHRLQLSKKEN